SSTPSASATALSSRLTRARSGPSPTTREASSSPRPAPTGPCGCIPPARGKEKNALIHPSSCTLRPSRGRPRSPPWPSAPTADGGVLAAGGLGGKVHLWEVHEAQGGEWAVKPLPAVGLPGAHPRSAIAALAWHKDGRTVAVSAGVPGGSGSVTLHDARTFRLRRTLRGETHPISQVALSPDGFTVASAGRDNVIRLHDSRTGKLYREFRGHTAPVRSLAFTPTGTVLISGGLDGTVRLWDQQRGAEIDTLQVANGPVQGMALHPAGQVLAVAGTGPLLPDVGNAKFGLPP